MCESMCCVIVLIFPHVYVMMKKSLWVDIKDLVVHHDQGQDYNLKLWRKIGRNYNV